MSYFFECKLGLESCHRQIQNSIRKDSLSFTTIQKMLPVNISLWNFKISFHGLFILLKSRILNIEIENIEY